MSVQLPAESFAETRACLEARARSVPSTARRPGTSVSVTPSARSSLRPHPARPTAATASASASPYVVVVHVPLATQVDESGEGSALAGELERDGLISTETLRQIACDATSPSGSTTT